MDTIHNNVFKVMKVQGNTNDKFEDLGGVEVEAAWRNLVLGII